MKRLPTMLQGVLSPWRLILGGVLAGMVWMGSAAFAAPSSVKSGSASWYSSEACRFNPDPRCPMANGRSLYEQEATQPYFAASWDYPFGTQLRVCQAKDAPSRAYVWYKNAWHAVGTQCVMVEVTDRGPARRLVNRGRLCDLSQAAFHALAPLSKGVIQITVEVVQ